MTRTTPARPHFIDDLITRLLEQVSLQFPVPGPRSACPIFLQGGPALYGWGQFTNHCLGYPRHRAVSQAQYFLAYSVRHG